MGRVQQEALADGKMHSVLTVGWRVLLGFMVMPRKAPLNLATQPQCESK
jgi:hypothetical protein